MQQTYAFERLTATSSSQLLVGYEQLTQEVFGYGSEERELFLDEHTILIVAVKQQDGQPCVVGGAFAWQDMNYLKKSDRDVALNTYEISGAVVMDEYRGQGLYKEISVMLRTQLARLAEAEGRSNP